MSHYGMDLSELESWFEHHGHGAVLSRRPLSGGDMCASQHVTTANGHEFFVKSMANAPATMFQAEVAGLDAIRRSRSLRVPKVFAHAKDWLVLEYLGPGPKRRDYWTVLGRELALMHQVTDTRFGFGCDNFCGATAQPNPRTLDGHRFFAEQRILYQGRLAYDNGLLQHANLLQLENVCARLPELIPAQPAALLHGDLWSGNIHTDSLGAPVLIDPACYYGWAEADIAMTLLFGGFTEEFYIAYQAESPMQPGWKQRIQLYNLYHLLNHLNLFGRSYVSQVIQVLKSYV